MNKMQEYDITQSAMLAGNQKRIRKGVNVLPLR